MTDWIPDLKHRDGPRYRAIAEALADDVESGRLPAGARLPTQRELAMRLGLTVGTVSRAYAEAQRQGLLSGEIGRGSFIRDIVHEGGRLAQPGGARAGVVDLSLNYPPSSGIEATVMRAAFKALAKDPRLETLLGYPQDEDGDAGHKAAAVDWLRRGGVEADIDRIILTAGVQHGLAVALAAICAPGDGVAAECLSYPGMRGLGMMQHLRLEGVAMDAHGIVPAAFDAACRGGAVRALYTVPTLQNPTATIMPEARRREIAAIARRHDALIIEDDIYGFMLPGAPSTFFSLAPESTIYVTGTSKNLAPGLRIGFVVAPRHLVSRIGAMVRATLWMPSPPMAEVFRRLVESGDGERLVAARHAEAAARQRSAAAALGKHDYRADPHGPHLWLRLPEDWSGRDFVSQARMRGLIVLSAQSFAIQPDAPNSHVRLCLGCPTDRSDMERGLATLRDMLQESPDLHRLYL